MSESLEERVIAAIGQQYALESEIGRGGMSVVYRARDVRLNRPVALKVLPPELAYDPGVRMRFTREAQTAAQLSHSHIVPIYDVGDREGIAYLVMGYVTGGNLAALLAREPKQPLDEVRRIVCEIADALAYAHDRGVIHRDIKPDNILLDGTSGKALVTDFGIARAMEAGTRLTQTGIAVGTPAYMSPEQAEGVRDVDGRADIYALGVVAYQMLTGRVPFSGGSTMAVLLKHVTEPPRAIAELRPETPRPLREAVERALMKSPEDRWPTAMDLRAALQSGDAALPAWRADRREPVRYASPIPESAPRRERGKDAPRGELRPVSPRRGSAAAQAPGMAPGTAPGQPADPRLPVREPPHLAGFTDEQRADIRLWHGRIHLLDRVKAARGYAVLTLAVVAAGVAGTIAGLAEGVPPAIVALIPPWYMARKLFRRGKSLRAAGLRLRRVFLMPRAKWVIPAPPPPPSRQQLEKLASRDVLESPLGAAVRRAAEDRAAILAIISALPRADRALLPDVEPTVKALVDRVVQLASSVHSLDQSLDARALEDLDARLASLAREPDSADRERRLTLLRRQRDTLTELFERRALLAHQLDSAGLALGNLRLDLVKLRSSGVQSAISDVSSATQEARALSREIDGVLAAAEELRGL